MDAASIFAILILVSIVAILIAVPVWLVRKIMRWRRGRSQASGDTVTGYAGQIEHAKAQLVPEPGRASLPILDASQIGYRTVGNEKVLAVQSDAKRMEMKSTGRYRTGGASISIPIMKGVRYRVGSGSIRSEKTWQVTGHGRLIVTDKALSFESREKNERISWTQIANVEILKDGFQIAKRSGPPRTYAVASPDPHFAAVVELMLARTS